MTNKTKKTAEKAVEKQKPLTKVELQAARGEMFVQLETAKTAQSKCIQEINRLTVEINKMKD